MNPFIRKWGNRGLLIHAKSNQYVSMGKNASIHKEITFHIYETREAIWSKPGCSLISEGKKRAFPKSLPCRRSRRKTGGVKEGNQISITSNKKKPIVAQYCHLLIKQKNKSIQWFGGGGGIMLTWGKILGGNQIWKHLSNYGGGANTWQRCPS
jgi:hypothetical protein